MFHFYEAITNTSGDSLAGYYARVLDTSTGEAIPLFSDNSGTPIITVSGVADMAVTDSAGNLSFYLDPGTYNVDLYAPDAVSFIKRIPNVGMTSTQGIQGPAGPMGSAGNVASTLADIKAADIANDTLIYDHATFKWTTGDYTGQADDTNTIESDDNALTVGAWIRQKAVSIQAADGNNLQQNIDHGGYYSPGGTGAQTRATATRLLESVLHATDYDADPSGGTSSATAILNTAVAARSSATDSSGRSFTKQVHLPAGKYTLDALTNLAATAGTQGLIISGDGATEIDYSGSTASFKFPNSRRIIFQNLIFKSSAVDDNQTAFTINYTTGNPLASVMFVNCEFDAFYKCFDVSGTGMCSEFSFYFCKFAQCYYLMYNANTQALNWNFYSCDWENNALVTTKDKTLSAAFLLTQGTKVNWYGGSAIFYGRLVLYNLMAAGAFQRVSHSVHFKGIRLELADEGGTHVPIIDRIDTGYVIGTNQPTTTLEDIEMIKLGTIGAATDIVFARIWPNCSLTIKDSNFQSCHVVGVLDANTSTACGSVVIDNCYGISYAEDTTNRTNDHDHHNVSFRPNNTSSGNVVPYEQRLTNLTVWAKTGNYFWTSGSTGSLPIAASSVTVPILPNGTRIRKMFVDCYTAVASGSITFDFRDAGDTTSYGSITLTAGQNNGEVYIGKEVGFQLPGGVTYIIKATGTAAVIKGALGFQLLG